MTVVIVIVVIVTVVIVTVVIYSSDSRAVPRLKSLQNSGAFWELFWVLLTKTEKFCGI